MDTLTKLQTALRQIADIGGNLTDDCLTSKTGPNDAVQRGLMYTEARRIALEALNQPDQEDPEDSAPTQWHHIKGDALAEGDIVTPSIYSGVVYFVKHSSDRGQLRLVPTLIPGIPQLNVLNDRAYFRLTSKAEKDSKA